MIDSRRRWLVGGVVLVLGLGLTGGLWLAAPGAALYAAFGRRPRRLLVVGVVCMGVLPAAWFVGSPVQLDLSAARIQDNTLATALAAGAIWILSVAVVREVTWAQRRSADEL